jgi:hypothetical protein
MVHLIFIGFCIAIGILLARVVVFGGAALLGTASGVCVACGGVIPTTSMIHAHDYRAGCRQSASDSIGENIPISDNVGGVNYFVSVVIRALRGARHFALVEALPYPTQGSLAISFRSGNSVRPNHLFGRNFDHDYYFELPRERGAGRPIITTVFYRTPRGCPGCPACEPNFVSCS